MRLWSIHPKYLDHKGLVALWREGLLAKAVLEGKTKGYKEHPQLIRFKLHEEPVKAINRYLFYIEKEACDRGYCFDKTKIRKGTKDIEKITVTEGQLRYELEHLKEKLRRRDIKKLAHIQDIIIPRPHPLFTAKKGKIEKWEKKKEEI